MSDAFSSTVGTPTAGDFLIEAIANAVALKLERMGLACQQRLMDVHDAFGT